LGINVVVADKVIGYGGIRTGNIFSMILYIPVYIYIYIKFGTASDVRIWRKNEDMIDVPNHQPNFLIEKKKRSRCQNLQVNRFIMYFEYLTAIKIYTADIH
jgi:hypothetical protein